MVSIVRQVLFYLLISLLITACYLPEDSNKRSPNNVSVASVAKAPEHSARIVFYFRKSKIGPIRVRTNLFTKVYIDGRFRFKLVSGEYQHADVKPGRHVLSIGGKHFRVRFEPGEVVYIRIVHVRKGPNNEAIYDHNAKLQVVTKKVALAEMGEKLKLSSRRHDSSLTVADAADTRPWLGSLRPCSKDYKFTQDCSVFWGATRKIVIDGVPMKIMATAKGDVVVVVARQLRADHAAVAFRIIKKTLQKHNIKIKKVRVFLAVGKTWGYVFELESDGYQYLTQYTKKW